MRYHCLIFSLVDLALGLCAPLIISIAIYRKILYRSEGQFWMGQRRTSG